MSKPVVDKAPPTDLAPPKTPEEKLADARKTIAYILVGVYVFLVAANVLIPITLYLTDRPDGPFSMSDLKDLSSAISSILAGLVGILGFVVGYYFKSIDDRSNT